MNQRLLAALALSVSACSSATQSQPAQRPRTVESVEQITASIQDSAMRERWRQAAAAGQLPSLSTLPVPDTAISTRKRVTVTGDVPLTRGPVIAPQTVADVRLVGLDTLRAYRGPITLGDTAGGRLRAALTAGTPAVEIHYKLPGNQPLLVLPGPHSLVYRDEMVNNTMRRELLLTSPNAPVLLHLNDGGAAPYDRAFRELPLRVRQVGQAEQRVSPVEITYADQQLVLRPGERRRARDGAGEVEFFVLSSYYLQPAEIETAEGDPYHVIMMMYRVR